MADDSLLTQPSIISETVWDKLSPKQKEIMVFMASRFEEWLKIREIKEGARLASLHGRELTSLNAKLANLKLGLKISCREEQEPYQIMWKLEKNYTT